MAHPPEQVHYHELGSVKLNYPCPISRQRVVSHSRMRCREVGPVNRITFCLSNPCRFTAHLLDPGWEPDTPWGPGGPPLTFLVLMVGAPTFSSITSHGGLSSTFFSVDGGCSWILWHHLPVAHRQCFWAFMVGAPEFSDSTSQGAHRWHFLVLMVGTPRLSSSTS
jgi:hypothetical protein